jgi:putative FmdB family regulatory protein
VPIYEYACQKCGHRLEALQKVSDSALRKCPACGALRLKKLVSAPQFRLKGTGWYETDFKKNGKRKLAGDGNESEGPKPDDRKAEDQKANDKKGDGDKKPDAGTAKDATPADAKAGKKDAAPADAKATKKAGRARPSGSAGT